MTCAGRRSRSHDSSATTTPRANQADDDAAEKRPHELHGRRRRAVLAAEQPLEQRGEERDRRRVVEQTLAFDEPHEPRRRADVTKNRDDRHRIRRRDDRAEHEARDDRDARERRQRKPDDDRGDDDRDDGEQQDRRGVLQHLRHFDRRGRLEEERWQQDVDERVGADRQARKHQRELAEHAARLRVLGKFALAFSSLPIGSDAFIYILLPALLFQSALTIEVPQMLEDAAPILLLAIVAVVVATYRVCAVASGVSIACLALGAMVARRRIRSRVVAIFS